ncbi:RWD-domain-containing protein [Russula brevipes]|nr:RWD-domain-containing protein [Russula brevipes]
MSSDVILEEFEVLESIYADELIKLSDKEIRIDIQPDSFEDGEESLKLALAVNYTDNYPDELPNLALEPLEGDVDEEEINALLDGAQAVGQENIGMAMTFTIVSHLRDQLSTLIRTRSEQEARTRGTPVTIESFNEWKNRFDREASLRKTREDVERLKAMTTKEREEYKRIGVRLTGRQLFEHDKNLATSDASLLEDGTVSVDVSQYQRAAIKEDDEEDRLEFSDSD